MTGATRILKQHRIAASLACAVLFGASPAAAQVAVPATSLSYSFSIPVVKAVPNPCTGRFALVDGTLTVAVETAAATDFRLKAKIASTGQAFDAASDGSIIYGTQRLPFDYSSSVATDTHFPDGKPSYFMQTINVRDFLIRQDDLQPDDSFKINAVLKLTFNDGVPGTPSVQRLEVSCR
jgi:hypothetical protein